MLCAKCNAQKRIVTYIKKFKSKELVLIIYNIEKANKSRKNVHN